MKIEITEQQQLEYNFSKNLVSFINKFNWLDFHLGFYLKDMASREATHLTYSQIQMMTVHRKISVLDELINSQIFEDSEEMVGEFNTWFKNISEVKSIRNEFVHGMWTIGTPKMDQPIICEATPLDPTQVVKFSLSEFLSFTNSLNQVADQFHVLRKKYQLGNNG